MSTVATNRKVLDTKSVSQKKAIDWKIFELQSQLITSEEPDASLVEECLLWLQPRHFSEVLEERVNDGRCGYPCCAKLLSVSNQNASYRIDYAEKKVFSIEMSKNYCSLECIEKAQILEKRFDVSVPYSRNLAKDIDPAVPSRSGIDAVLDLLGPQPKLLNESTANSKPPSEDILPPFTSNIMDTSGEVIVEFIKGLPYREAADVVATNPTSTPSSSATPNGPEKLRSHVETKRKFSEDDDSELIDIGAGAARTLPVPHHTKAVPSIEETFAMMKELRSKHNLDNPIAAVQRSPIGAGGSTRFTNGTLRHDADPVSVRAAKTVGNVAENPELHRVGTIGRRPGPKTVRWGENVVQTLPAVGLEATTTSTTVSSVPITTPAQTEKSIVKSNIAKSQSKITEKNMDVINVRPIGQGGKSAGLILPQKGHGMVVERTNPTAMSAAAMMRKRETTDLDSPSVSDAAEENVLVEKAGRLFIGASTTAGEEDGDGDHWVDVDPTELLMASEGNGDEKGGDAAFSIEGYIANVKKTIRVSPATAIKNLSHSPYSSSRPDDAPEESVRSQSDEDGEEWDIASDNWDEVDEESADVNPSAAPRSLFLALWSTMDELFSNSPGSIFNAADDSSYSPASTLTHTADANWDVNSERASNEMNRPPIAMEQQSVHHAFIKLLQRGIQTAENQLGIFEQRIFLPEERALFNTIKRKVLTAANNSLQRRSNAQTFGESSGSETLGTSVGAGLQANGWALIGLLVLDAIVTKQKIGPLRGLTSDNSTANTGKGVAVRAWGGQVEEIAQNLQRGGKDKIASKLREGDFDVLRSFFDYV